MNKVILSAAIIGLTFASERSKPVEIINEVGGFIVHHQDEIKQTLKNGIGAARLIQDIAMHGKKHGPMFKPTDEVPIENVDEELFSVKDAAKKVGHAAKAAGGFVVKHQGQIEGAINTGINVAKFVGEIAADDEEFSIKNDVKKVGQAVKKAAEYVAKHQSEISGPIRPIRYIAADDEEFSIKDAAKKVGHAAKEAGGFVVKHQGQIEGAINTGINVAKFVGEIAGDGEEVDDDELFNIKNVAKKVGSAAKKAGKFIVKHHKEIEQGVEIGVKVIGYIAADEVEPSEKEFLGF